MSKYSLAFLPILKIVVGQLKRGPFSTLFCVAACLQDDTAGALKVAQEGSVSKRERTRRDSDSGNMATRHCIVNVVVVVVVVLQANTCKHKHVSISEEVVPEGGKVQTERGQAGGGPAVLGITWHPAEHIVDERTVIPGASSNEGHRKKPRFSM